MAIPKHAYASFSSRSVPCATVLRHTSPLRASPRHVHACMHSSLPWVRVRLGVTGSGWDPTFRHYQQLPGKKNCISLKVFLVAENEHGRVVRITPPPGSKVIRLAPHSVCCTHAVRILAPHSSPQTHRTMSTALCLAPASRTLGVLQTHGETLPLESSGRQWNREAPNGVCGGGDAA